MLERLHWGCTWTLLAGFLPFLAFFSFGTLVVVWHFHWLLLPPFATHHLPLPFCCLPGQVGLVLLQSSHILHHASLLCHTFWGFLPAQASPGAWAAPSLLPDCDGADSFSTAAIFAFALLHSFPIVPFAFLITLRFPFALGDRVTFGLAPRLKSLA